MIDAERYAVTLRKVVIDGEELWRASVRELPDLAEFAATRDEAMDLALDAIESLKKAADEEKRSFPDPIDDDEEYSGRVTLRMSKSMHRAAALRATYEGVSLNSYIVECVALNSGGGVTEVQSQVGATVAGRIDLYSRHHRFDYGACLTQILEQDWYAQTVSNATSGLAANIGTQFFVDNATQVWEAPTIPPHLLETKRRART